MKSFVSGSLILAALTWGSDPAWGQQSEEKPTIDAGGKIGAGVGVTAGSADLLTINQQVSLRGWLSDDLAIQPSLTLFGFIPNDNRGDPGFNISPEVLALFSVIKGRTTRFNVGGGFGMEMLLRAPNQTSNREDVDLTMRIPVRLGVEHFFAEWFSMELGAQTDFLRFEYANSDFQQVRFGFDTTAFSALLFFYVD